MKIIKYPSAFFIFLFFFLSSPHLGYSWELGGKLGGTFQSFYLDGKDNANEDSGFGVQSSLFFGFLPHERVLLMTELGFSAYPLTFYTPWIGVTAAFVIYPQYLPFIGISIRQHFYDRIFSSTNRWSTAIYFSAGSKIFIRGAHSLWAFFDYLIFQSLYQEYSSSSFSVSLAYSYRFGMPQQDS